MSIDDEIAALKHTIDVQEARGEDFRSMTLASRHMRAAAGFLEHVSDPRAQKATQLLLDAITSLTSIDVPEVPT